MPLLALCCSFYSNAQTDHTPISNPIPTTTNIGNWNLVFEDNFNYTDPNILKSNWVVQHYGNGRFTNEPPNTEPIIAHQNHAAGYMQHQLYTSDHVTLDNTNVNLKVYKLTDEEFAIGPVTNNNTFNMDGNGNTATHRAGNIWSRKPFLFGYIEASVKIPKGKGAFPTFWLFPVYREDNRPGNLQAWNQTPDGNDVIHTTNVSTGQYCDYPEEIDIFERRSVMIGSELKHLLTHVSFGTKLHKPEGSDDWVEYTSAQGRYEISRKAHLATDELDGFKTYAVLWNMFGINWYIGNELVATFAYDDRPSAAEPMNIILSNQVMYNHPVTTPFVDGNNSYPLAFEEGPINNENMLVDYVRVYQEKKYKNKVVWTSGNSRKFGQDWRLGIYGDDRYIMADFDNDKIDDLLTISNDNKFAVMHHYDVNNMEYTKGEWTSRWFNNGNFKIDNWNLNANDKIVKGNFNGVDGDELLLVNAAGGYAVTEKFVKPLTGTPYWENQYYNQGGGKIQSYNSSLYWTLTPNDKYIVGNFNGAGGDELLCVNTTKSQVLQYYVASAGTTPVTNRWNLLRDAAKIGGTTNAWTFTVNDEFIVQDFNGDGKDDLLCIRKSGSTSLASLYSWNTTTKNFDRIWTNNSNNLIADWYINSGDKFLAGNYLNNSTRQLLCISQNQIYNKFLRFNTQTQNFVIAQDNYNPAPTNVPDGKFFVFSHRTGLNAKANLFSIEQFLSRAGYQFRAKWLCSLVDFAPGLVATQARYASEENNITEDGKSLKLSVYPNPANETITLSINGSFKIFDTKGVEYKIQSNDNTIDVSNLASGSYIVTVSNNNGNYSALFVKN